MSKSLHAPDRGLKSIGGQDARVLLGFHDFILESSSNTQKAFVELFQKSYEKDGE